MKLQSITAAAVVTVLLLSMVGAGAAAPTASSVGDTPVETDTDEVSQSNVVSQSDVTDVSSVTSEIDESSTVTDDDTVEVTADGVGSDAESVFADLGIGQDDGASSLLESLFGDDGLVDGIDDGSAPDDADDGTDETDGDEADETDGDDEADETDDDDEADETDGDDGTDETDGDDGADETDGDDGTDETDGDETDETGGNDGANETDGDETDDTDEGDEAADGSSDELDRAALERYVHEAVNEERAARGLEPLEFDTELRDIARAHSEDMAERGYFAHVDPDGNDVTDRYAQAGYECDANGYTGGENLAQTWYDTPVVNDDGETVRYETEQELADGIVTQWMNSPGHRENLLATQWEHEGIGVSVTDDNRVFATQNFC